MKLISLLILLALVSVEECAAVKGRGRGRIWLMGKRRSHKERSSGGNNHHHDKDPKIAQADI